MAHPEIELISNVIETGDFVSLKKKGVTPGMFRLSEPAEIFQWLWDEFHDPSQRGEVPTKERLLRKFPEFDYSSSRNSVNALVNEIRRDAVNIELNELLEEVGESLREDEDPTLILDAFLPKFRHLGLISHDDDGILMSGAAEAIRQEYTTQKSAGGVVGIPYPWELLNNQTGGMRDEEFIVIYGRPGNMKTWLLCVLAAHAYNANCRVMVFSKEIQRATLRLRVSSVLAGVSYDRLRKGNLSIHDEEHFFDFLEAVEELEELEAEGARKRALLFMSDKGKRRASTVQDLITAAERFQPDIIFVDGFYLMRDARSGAKTVDWKQIAHISQDLKGMAQYLECPVVGTTQANRANSKTVTGDLDDLSFADAIGQDADMAVRCFRGPNPSGVGASLMLIFTKGRESIVRPFIINANPGSDFSVLSKTANISQFIADKARMETSEGEATGGSTNAAPTTKKKKRRPDPFRD